MQLGFVGTGTMGAPMAGCLIDAGHQLTVYDVRSEATAALCARGARPEDSPRGVAAGRRLYRPHDKRAGGGAPGGRGLPGLWCRDARCAG